MKFIEHNFGTLPQFIQIAGKYWNELGWVFRGQGRDVEEWPLLPKAGRPEYFSEATPYWKKRNQITNDLGDFHTWRESAIAFTNQLPTNDFECLAYAQHYGLATRLLDWSTNPLVALFFAVESDLDKDGVVICYNPSGYIDRDNISLIDCPAVACVKSRPFDRRIAAQSGVFTYHPLPHQVLLPKAVSGEGEGIAPDGFDLVCLRVPADMKQLLQRHLGAIGVSRKTLFPGLEGLSSFINWNRRRQVAFRKTRKKK